MDEDDEEEDLDALIEELESLDPDEALEAEIETIGAARLVPEEMLQTDPRVGLIEPEVVARRKKYGLNQMREAKESLWLKFLGYFVGPIQFVMEVRRALQYLHVVTGPDTFTNRLLLSWLPVCRTGSTLA